MKELQKSNCKWNQYTFDLSVLLKRDFDHFELTQRVQNSIYSILSAETTVELNDKPDSYKLIEMRRKTHDARSKIMDVLLSCDRPTKLKSYNIVKYLLLATKLKLNKEYKNLDALETILHGEISDEM